MNMLRLLWSGRTTGKSPAEVRAYLYGRRSYWRSGKR